jgi:hypothetical protein
VVARPVNIDYHIAFDTNYYSVPYNLVQEPVEVRSTPTTVEIFYKGQRVASHLRARGAWTHHHHCRTPPTVPPGASGMDALAHGALGASPSVRTRPDCSNASCRQAASGDGLSFCLGIIRLAGQYSVASMEAAAERALVTGACRYQSVKSILKNSLDAAPR